MKLFWNFVFSEMQNDITSFLSRYYYRREYETDFFFKVVLNLGNSHSAVLKQLAADPSMLLTFM